MHGVLNNASLARIPAGALDLLGRLRVYASVQVRADGRHVWVRWDEAGYEILRALLPVAGAQFFERLEDRWHLCGHSLPAFDVPEDRFHPLATALTPGPQQSLATVNEPAPRVVLALKRSTQQQPASALLCAVKPLAKWANMAPADDLARLQVACCENQVLLTGQRLPVIPGERFWGERLLSPLGWAPEPGLPENALLEAIGVSAQETVVMRGGEIEIIPRDAFRTLTRASARLGAA